MQLPVSVAQHRGSMGKIGMALGLALRPISDVVLTNHAKGASHPNQRSEIDEHPLKPEWVIKRSVDQPPVHAY